MLIADYTASRAKKFLTLSLLSNGRREHVETVTAASPPSAAPSAGTSSHHSVHPERWERRDDQRRTLQAPDRHR
jgi:hypothetical protein